MKFRQPGFVDFFQGQDIRVNKFDIGGDPCVISVGRMNVHKKNAGLTGHMEIFRFRQGRVEIQRGDDHDIQSEAEDGESQRRPAAVENAERQKDKLKNDILNAEMGGQIKRPPRLAQEAGDGQDKREDQKVIEDHN